MLTKGIIDEDFVNYKIPSMFIACPTCSFKCEKECGKQVCQNSTLANSTSIEIDNRQIVSRYMNNPITKAICFAGLEPLDNFENVASLIYCFRANGCKDDIVIYTGYTEAEAKNMTFKVVQRNNLAYRNYPYSVMEVLKSLTPIVIKYGRFIPNQESHYDEVLGVNLASDNQYAVRYE